MKWNIFTVLMFTAFGTIAFLVIDVIYSNGVIGDFFIKETTLRFLCSSIIQGYAALIGILGAFLIFYNDTFKNKIISIRKEISSMIKDEGLGPQRLTASLNNDEFLSYLHKQELILHDRPRILQQIQGSKQWLKILIDHQNSIKDTVSVQFLFLFLTIIFAFTILLFMDMYYEKFNTDVGTALLFKLTVYVSSAFAITSLLSIFYSIASLVYGDTAVI
jgi:hypothetical protein